MEIRILVLVLSLFEFIILGCCNTNLVILEVL